MPIIFAKSPFKFLLLWTVATCGGFLASLFWVEIGERGEVEIIQVAIGGIAIALPQGLILRDTVITYKWVLFTLVAWIGIIAIGVGAIGWMIPPSYFLPLRLLNGLTAGIVGGLVMGIAQWLAISQRFSWAWRWILVNSLSWAIAIPLGSTVGFILRRHTRLFLGELAGLFITWLVVAILTGMNAYRLFRH